MGWAPDTTLSEVEIKLRSRGYSGVTIFGDAHGWRANLKGDGQSYTCGRSRPTIFSALAQVLGEEDSVHTDLEDLI